MKLLKRILVSLVIFIGVIFLVGWLTIQLTPNPVSYLVRKQFDTSQQTQIYPRPAFYTQDVQQVSVEKDVSYQSTGKNNRMDIYVPKKQSEKVPVLFWVHGGAYVGGDKRDCEDYLTMLSAKTNTVVVNLNYELAPEAKHPAPVRQLNEAIATIKERKIVAVDWENVLLGGDSAGAQIASEYLIRLSNLSVQKDNSWIPVLKNTQVKKFISLSGLLEPDKFAEIDDPISRFLFKQSGWAYFDQKEFTQDEALKELSLANHANELSQAFFFTDGNEKTFTKQMQTTVKALEQAAVSVTEISYKKPVLEHEYQFDFSKPEAEKTFAALVRFVNDQS